MIFTYTPKEREQLSAIESDFETVLESLAALRDIKDKHDTNNQQFKDAKADTIKKISAIDQCFAELIEELDNARFSKLKTPKAILEDAKQQTNDAIIYAYVQIDSDIALSDREASETAIADLSNGGLFSSVSRWDFSKAFKDQKKAKFNPEKSPFLLDEIGLIAFIKRSVLDKHIEALKGLPEAEQLENYVLQTVANSPYTTETKLTTLTTKKEKFPAQSNIFSQSHLVVYHNKLTDHISQINKNCIEIDQITGEATAIIEGLTVLINDHKIISGKNFINAEKILIAAIAVFTNQNHYSKNKKSAINYRVSFSMHDFSRACGRDVETRETSTPEEAAKEKRRIANLKKEERKRVNEALKALASIQSAEWRKPSKKGGDNDYFISQIISSRGIENGIIKITFNPDFADSLLQSPLTLIPITLLTIDARNPNAFNMGYKIAIHYSLDNNQIKGTAIRLKVETLLKYTDLPNITTVQKQRKSWEERIKDPFENSLDVLTREGFLEDWEYTRAKGIKLTDAEAMQIADYETFKNLYITFKLKEAPNHTERLTRRAKEKEKNLQRNKTTKKKK